ncbi:kinase-like protein [Meredithblackwellia eburnea MCA 4105]
MLEKDDNNNALKDFKLGERLGSGSFGTVVKAFNWTSGETVAIKQIGLSNIPKSQLPDIMSEIDLLKNLHHPNIVQYRGFVKTSEFLYIILEYCENGSLSSVTKKYGRFPESLVALYILQVLQGLLYLHDQGVIHRDIKGENILATKEGSIKLADFGVATRTGGPTDLSVVGSPYWMAPEVVDQTGATTASDIWSLGALVIELITGKPPYAHLDPMPALFRIVNDDCPPIPETASAVVRDFLLQCFQKDANLRVGARKLLRHPWMVVARRQAEANARGGRPRPLSGYDDTVLKVQEWNEALNGNTNPRTRKSDEHQPHRISRRPSAELASVLQQQPAPMMMALPRRSGVIDLVGRGTAGGGTSAGVPVVVVGGGREGNSTTTTGLVVRQGRGSISGPSGLSPPSSSAPASASIPTLPLSVVQQRAMVAMANLEPEVDKDEEGRDDDNWDSDFEEGISSSKLAAMDRESSSGSATEGGGGGVGGSRRGGDGADSEDDDDEESNAEDERGGDEEEEDDFQDANSHTIRPASRMSLNPPTPPATEVEDYSDLVADDEADPFQGRVNSLREYNTQKKRILHPKDISDSFLSNNSAPASSINILSNRNQNQPPSRLPTRPASAPTSRQPSTSSSVSSSGPTRPPPGPRPRTDSGRSIIDNFREVESEEDYSDVFGKGSVDSLASNLENLQLNTKLSNKSWLGEEDSDEDDPFAEVDQEEEQAALAETDLETNLARDKLARLAALVAQLVDTISSDTDEYAIREAALEMINVFEDSPEMKAQFIKCHGLLAVIEVLQVTRSRELLGILLRVLNLIVGSDPEALEKLCLVGGGPVVMSFASNKYSREIRLEAALFICAMCRTSLLTIQMFVSCRGLKTLVDMMDENYSERKDLVWMAVDGISRVFELHASTPRNDYCRIFVTEGLLEPLAAALMHVAKDDDDLAESAKAKIVHILLVFAQSDKKVKEALATRAVILRLVKALQLLEPDLLAPMLKTIKTLTMLPSALDTLQHANVIDALVSILSDQFDGKVGAEIQNHVVNALFNLCRLSKNRQEEAAVAGVIPILQRVVQANSPLKQFALPILCDFAHASKTCRKLLWQYDGLGFYLGLLKDPFWANPALDAIVSWLLDETSRVEDFLVEQTALDGLLRTFCRTRTTTFESLLEPFLKLLRTSTVIASKLGVQSAFWRRIIDRLTRGGKAVVRLNLLRITKTVFDSLADRRDKVVRIPHLATTVAALAEEDPAILVKELAKELNREFIRTRDDAGNASKRNLVSRVLRRTQSGSSPPPSPGVRSRQTSLSTGAAAPTPRRSGTLFGRAS